MLASINAWMIEIETERNFNNYNKTSAFHL